MLDKCKKIFFTDFFCILLLTGCDNLNLFKADVSNVKENEICYVKQSINYEDSNEIIYNPDMGFYSAVDLQVLYDGVDNLTSKCKEIKKTASKYSGSYSSGAKFDLLHLKFDLSAFSDNAIRAIDDNGKTTKGNTGDLTQEALDGIEQILKVVEDAGKTSIVRFCYDYKYQGQKKYADENNKVIIDNLVKATGNQKKDSNGYRLYTNSKGDTVYADVEPNPEDFQTIINHINVIAPLLIKHMNSITAIECGMIGPYGEMHSTTLAKNKGSAEYGYIIEVMDAFLKALGNTKIPFLVRQPAFLKAYISSNENNDKFGLYNDGYLGSGSDLGTFKEDRKTEIEYLMPFTEKTPYGGELCYDDGSNEGLWRARFLNDTVDEMYKVHLSFLNIGWNHHVLKWADSIDSYYNEDGVEINDKNLVDIGDGNEERFFQYLIKHMGYRYVLIDSKIGMDNEKKHLGFKLTFKNNGFANIPYHREKIMTVIFVKDDEKVSEQIVSNQIFDGKEKEFYVSISNLPQGEYQVFLKISDSNEDKSYPIELANTGIWDNTWNANEIGSIIK